MSIQAESRPPTTEQLQRIADLSAVLTGERGALTDAFGPFGSAAAAGRLLRIVQAVRDGELKFVEADRAVANRVRDLIGWAPIGDPSAITAEPLAIFTVCSKCGEQKRRSEFAKNRKQCKECVREYNRAYRGQQKRKGKGKVAKPPPAVAAEPEPFALPAAVAQPILDWLDSRIADSQAVIDRCQELRTQLEELTE